MTDELNNRLNQIEDRITSDSFLSSQGIGNEIACYIFDYAAEDELKVRAHIEWMTDRIASNHKHLKVLHLNIFEEIIDLLEDRKLLEKSKTVEDSKLIMMLKGPLEPERVIKFIDSKHNLKEFDLILMSRMGSVWPMLRAHNLLNNLHTAIENVPLVLFYPGSFDSTSLRLFDLDVGSKSESTSTRSYYRAFNLIPKEATQ